MYKKCKGGRERARTRGAAHRTERVLAEVGEAGGGAGLRGRRHQVLQGSQGRGIQEAFARRSEGQADQGAVDPGVGRVVRGAVLQGGGPVRATQVNSTA